MKNLNKWIFHHWIWNITDLQNERRGCD